MTLEPTEPEGGVPLSVVIQASLEIYDEWEAVEEARQAGDLPQEEAAAYQEGVLRALSILNSRTGVSIETMDQEAREALGAEDPSASSLRTADEDESDDPGECPACGTERRWEMGFSDPFCPVCGG